MSKQPKSNEELVEKYATQTPEEMEQDQENLQSEVALQSRALDQNISSFSSKTDEMKDTDGTLLAIVRRPTASQFKRFVPPDLAKYKDKPEKIPTDVALAYEQDIYKLMEELIVQPKHTAQEWQDRVGDDFVAAFQAHLFKVREQMSENVKRFLQRT